MIATRKGKNSRKNDLKWTRKDHIVGFYYYKWGTKFLDLSIEEISKIMGTTPASFSLQRANFKMIDTGRGLEDVSKGQLKVFYDFKNSPRYTVYKEVEKHLKLDEIRRNKILSQSGRRLRALR